MRLAGFASIRGVHHRDFLIVTISAAATMLFAKTGRAAEYQPAVPRFKVENMDRTIDPATNFYKFAAGTWLRNNPVPADKSRWGGFEELQDRNWQLIHNILEQSTHEEAPVKTPKREVGDFYASAMNTNLLEQLGFKPLTPIFRRIEHLKSVGEMMAYVEELHERGMDPFFRDSVEPDEKNSTVYAYNLSQGGLGLPDRDYYLEESFASKREHYREHIIRMLALLGERRVEASGHAKTIINLETALAKASRSRVDLRDPNANYNKVAVGAFERTHGASGWQSYFSATGLADLGDVIVGQPEFFNALDQLLESRPLDEWKTYLRWTVLRNVAPYLHHAADKEHFAFYGTELSGQLEQEPRWRRSAKMIDRTIGEALGQLYVEKYFTPEARARMDELVGNLREVFRDRLSKLDWMSADTRTKALAKFDRFTQKIGYPDKFRDYSTVEIRPDDLLGNVQRASIFESRREMIRVGKPVDKTEWHMTPQTVNAYFNPVQNEIVFPAGILQPPFFDVEADDAINYGAIGMVIGHEITHGYDDQGRKYDAEGNLNEWWSDKDSKEFDARAQKVVDQYNAYEAAPKLHVNGKLTLGENIADLGGASIAYEAMERALAKDPSKRKLIDGFTPEQRFFLSIAQLWRTNWRDAELQRRITVDPHSPGQFRAIGAAVNLPEFYEAFGIKEGSPMWRPLEDRAKIW